MKNLTVALRALYPITYVHTHNDLEVVKTLQVLQNETISIFHPLLGQQSPWTFEEAVKKVGWPEKVDVLGHLKNMVRVDPVNGIAFYVFFEADTLLWDSDFQTALRIVHLQRQVDPTKCKQVVLVGSKGEIPEDLQPLVTICNEREMSQEAVKAKVDEVNQTLVQAIVTKYNLSGGLLTPGLVGTVRSPIEIDNAVTYMAIRVKDDHKAGKPLMTVEEYVKEFGYERYSNRKAAERAAAPK